MNTRRLKARPARAAARKTAPVRSRTPHLYNVIIERDVDGWYVASVPELRGCHTQAKSLDQLMTRAREAIRLCLEVHGESRGNEFIGIQRVAVSR